MSQSSLHPLQQLLQPPDGHPMHLTPFFFSLTIFVTASPITITIAKVAITFPIFYTAFLGMPGITLVDCFPPFIIKAIAIPIIIPTTINPGINPEPTEPVVIIVPI